MNLDVIVAKDKFYALMAILCVIFQKACAEVENMPLLNSPVLLLIAVPAFIGWLLWYRPRWRAVLLATLWLIYGYAVLSVTLFPIALSLHPGSPIVIQLSLSDLFTWAPFQTFGNFALLMPLAWLLAMSWRQFRHLWPNLAACLLVSLSIESIQLLGTWLGVINRSFDIVDLFLNGVGALVSFIAYKIASRLLARR